MTYVDTNIQDAINDSILHDEIVIIEERIDTQPWVGWANGLAAEADDWVKVADDEDPLYPERVEVREYWGEDSDGDDWRIHLIGTR